MINVSTMPIYCDNESYIKITMNPIYYSKTKYFTIHLKYIQQFTKIERIKVIYVPSAK
jgi:peptidase E